jgi:hypothetical protein
MPTMPADISFLRRRHAGHFSIAQAAKLIGTLEDDEKDILMSLQGGVDISGRLDSPDDVAVFNFWPAREPGKRQPKMVFNRVDGAMVPLRRLVKAGWLRFADIMGEGFGNFYMTEEGKQVWKLKR